MILIERRASAMNFLKVQKRFYDNSSNKYHDFLQRSSVERAQDSGVCTFLLLLSSGGEENGDPADAKVGQGRIFNFGDEFEPLP